MIPFAELKGRQDFEAGRKDDALYASTEEAGSAYRKGWQSARRDALYDETGRVKSLPAPEQESCPENTTPEIGAKPAGEPVSISSTSNEQEKMDIPEPLALAPTPPDLPLAVEPPPPEPPAAPPPAADDPEQMTLLDVAPDWKEKWTGMPDFAQRDLTPWASLPVHFKSRADRDAFSKLVGQKLTDDTRSIWFPKAEIGRYADKRYATEAAVSPRFPIYIPTKGRYDSRLTMKALDKMAVPYRIVVEGHEVEKYAAHVDRARILVLPWSKPDSNTELVNARNWILEHSIAEGHRWHWQLDDNIKAFYRLHENLKVPVKTGSTFRAAEDFVDRYENVMQGGFQYFMFASRKTVIPPFTLNTRIYSCTLNNNAMPFRYRGVYNDDTDISIRVLKAGFCTVLFNAFLAEKSVTMTVKGGNTPIYQDDGRLKMAESLRDQHPDVVTVTRKWDRWQHHVDYSPFKRNALKLRAGVEVPTESNNYGMVLERLDESAGVPLEPPPPEEGAILPPREYGEEG